MDTRSAALTEIIFVFLIFSILPLSAGGENNFSPPVDEARMPLRERNASEGPEVFKTLIARSPSFPAVIGAAGGLALMDRPEEALTYYRHALELAGENPMERRISLFGAARMLLWLERYAEAERIYEELLAQPLSKEDQSVAAVGLLRSLSFQDKPIRAYRSLPMTADLSPLERMELARAALWAGWPDKAAGLLQQEIPLEPETRLARELESLRSDVQAATADSVNLGAGYISDSDGLRIRKSELAAGKTSAGSGNFGLVFQHQGFEHHDQQLAMNSLQARYSSTVGNGFQLLIQAGPAAYGDWRTALWSGSAVYPLTDEIRYEAFAGREAVETFIAFDRHTSMDTVGLGASYTPVSRLLLSASVYRQSFRDDNSRFGGTGKMTTSISERFGLDIQLRARYFENSRTDTAGYFNPERFHEEKLLFALERPISSDWRFSALAGPGIQNTSPGDGGTMTLLVESTLRGTMLNGLSLSLDYGYSSSAVAGSFGYRRVYTGLTLLRLW